MEKEEDALNLHAQEVVEGRLRKEEIKEKNEQTKKDAILEYLVKERICPMCGSTRIEMKEGIYNSNSFWRRGLRKILGVGRHTFTCKKCGFYATVFYEDETYLRDWKETNYEEVIKKVKKQVFY